MDIKQTVTPDPRFPIITKDQMWKILEACGGDEDNAASELNRHLRSREESIEMSKFDPLRYGFEPEIWTKARNLLDDNSEIHIGGGNRSTKTELVAKYIADFLSKNEDRVVACFRETEMMSQLWQQSRVYKFLPPEWRDLGKKGKTTNIKYTKQKGFSDCRFILPNSSMCIFYNYKQDPDIFEGPDYDIIWLEELFPLGLLQTLRFRLSEERDLKIIKTYTPKRGVTPAVKEGISGMDVIETQPCDLLDQDRVHYKACPKGHLPLVMQHSNAKKKRAAIFFPLGSSPWQPETKIRNELIGAREGVIKIRAYGWADNIEGNTFAKYDSVHKITRKRFNEIVEDGGTRYMAIDPAEVKPWFIKWYFLTPNNWHIVYREWPKYSDYGDWAEPHEKQMNWKPGLAQSASAGLGFRAYKKEILEAEGAVWDEVEGAWDMSKAEVIERRWMDPRSGGKEVPSVDEGSSIISKMQEVQPAEGHLIEGPEMIFYAAYTGRGGAVNSGIQMINDLMDWNETEPISVLNCPKWYVVDDLYQTDMVYREWQDGMSERCALKDILDPDRYYIVNDPYHYNESDFETQTQGEGGY